MRFLNLEFPKNFNDYSLFNPSIIKLDNNDYYLLSCRAFRRLGESNSNTAVTIGSRNHPWLGGNIQSPLWWQVTDEGFDGTLFFILRLFKSKFSIIRQLFKLDYILDVRLFESDKGEIIATGNKLVNNRVIIVKSIIHLINTDFDNDPYNIEFGDFRPLCLSLSGVTEKNWSYWSYNKINYISYIISPRHIVFVEKLNTKEEDISSSLTKLSITNTELSNPIQCTPLLKTENNLFGSITKYYKDTVLFSLSTPALPFLDGKYLGVGHTKINYSVKNYRELNNSDASLFIDENRDLMSHPTTFYLMFFYTFNPETLEIIDISNSFIPPTTNDGVVFPTGLTMVNTNNYLISYGEADFKCKFMIFSTQEILELIKDQNEYTVYNYQFISYHKLQRH